MNGETTKYYQYKSSTSASVTIPKAIAKAMNWNHKDEIRVIIKTLNGNTGLFLFKPEKKNKKKENDG
jgi:antitoxin component of MazEF toxin-antitoxin module